MKIDDKRKLSSRLNALKSTGPKSPHGKHTSSLNASTHGAYARSIVPAKASPTTKPWSKPISSNTTPTTSSPAALVSQMATTLWRLNRIAPAESYLLRIQLDRMEPAIRIEFDDIPAAALYALGVSSLESQGTAQSQLLSQERRPL